LVHAHLHPETHLVARNGWLRAAVLGANDGIVSTASLIVGVAAASASTSEVLVAGVAGLVAGAMSMAAGEYVRGDGGATAADLDRAVYRGSIAHLRNRHAEKPCRRASPLSIAAFMLAAVPIIEMGASCSRRSMPHE
jgi:hypothetical protein